MPAQLSALERRTVKFIAIRQPKAAMNQMKAQPGDMFLAR
jgi:hypothetical protein